MCVTPPPPARQLNARPPPTRKSYTPQSIAVALPPYDPHAKTSVSVGQQSSVDMSPRCAPTSSEFRVPLVTTRVAGSRPGRAQSNASTHPSHPHANFEYPSTKLIPHAPTTSSDRGSMDLYDARTSPDVVDRVVVGASRSLAANARPSSHSLQSYARSPDRATAYSNVTSPSL